MRKARDLPARGLRASLARLFQAVKPALMVAFLILLTGCATTAAPPRPQGVPTSAVWAGGADGGAWIQCKPVAKEPHLHYDCTVYFESGSVWVSGGFVVAERKSGKDEFPGGYWPPEIRSFNSFDGRTIYLSETRRLVPYGRE